MRELKPSRPVLTAQIVGPERLVVSLALVEERDLRDVTIALEVALHGIGVPLNLGAVGHDVQIETLGESDQALADLTALLGALEIEVRDEPAQPTADMLKPFERATCTLPLAIRLGILAEKQSPCAGCNEARPVCGGEPRVETRPGGAP